MPSTFTQLMCVDMLQGLMEFGADHFVLEKQSFLGFDVIAKRRLHQRPGSPPITLSQLMRVDRLHALLGFAADFLGLESKPPPDDRSTVRHMQTVGVRGQHARSP